MDRFAILKENNALTFILQIQLRRFCWRKACCPPLVAKWCINVS